MSSFQPHVNFGYSTVAVAPSPATTGTSLTVQAGNGLIFPTPPFEATIWAASTLPNANTSEIVYVTAIVTDTFTIVRNDDSSNTRSIIVGDQIAATITANIITSIESATNLVNATSVNCATFLNVAGISILTGNTTHGGYLNVATSLQVSTGQPQFTVNSTGYVTSYGQGAPMQPSSNIALAPNYGLCIPQFFAPMAGVYVNIGAGAYVQPDEPSLPTVFGIPMQPTTNLVFTPNYGFVYPQFFAPQAGANMMIGAGAYIQIQGPIQNWQITNL